MVVMRFNMLEQDTIDHTNGKCHELKLILGFGIQWISKYIMMLSNQLTPYNGGVQYYLRDRDYCQLDDPIERKA